MTKAERERGFVVRQCVEGVLSQAEAAERLGVGVRQVKRLVRRWREAGDAGLISRQRGRLSHRRMSEALRSRIGLLLTETYPDFGPTLAAEKLLERDGIKVSAETVRQIQIDQCLWRPKRRRARRCSSCATGGRGSASWSRSMVARTTGLRGERRAAHCRSNRVGAVHGRFLPCESEERIDSALSRFVTTYFTRLPWFVTALLSPHCLR